MSDMINCPKCNASNFIGNNKCQMCDANIKSLLPNKLEKKICSICTFANDNFCENCNICGLPLNDLTFNAPTPPDSDFPRHRFKQPPTSPSFTGPRFPVPPGLGNVFPEFGDYFTQGIRGGRDFSRKPPRPPITEERAIYADENSFVAERMNKFPKNNIDFCHMIRFKKYLNMFEKYRNDDFFTMDSNILYNHLVDDYEMKPWDAATMMMYIGYWRGMKENKADQSEEITNMKRRLEVIEQDKKYAQAALEDMKKTQSSLPRTAPVSSPQLVPTSRISDFRDNKIDVLPVETKPSVDKPMSREERAALFAKKFGQ